MNAVILAGGRNSRIRLHKALLPVGGAPILQRIIEVLSPWCNEIILVTNEPELYRSFHLPLVSDYYQKCGPMGGIHAGLSFSREEDNLVVPCDMPFLHEAVVQVLQVAAAEHPEAEVVVPRWSCGLEPLHAIYRRRCLPVLVERLERGQYGLHRAFGALRVVEVDLTPLEQKGVNLHRVFMNINTRADWRAAEELARQ
ncbi:MAG: molybdenum cofactor guanylyltransferase [Bacillota bacterium]|nr:molybdenum cofactor guanylyltransferase [Bacillota bacterium]